MGSFCGKSILGINTSLFSATVARTSTTTKHCTVLASNGALRLFVWSMLRIWSAINSAGSDVVNWKSAASGWTTQPCCAGSFPAESGMRPCASADSRVTIRPRRLRTLRNKNTPRPAFGGPLLSRGDCRCLKVKTQKIPMVGPNDKCCACQRNQ